MEGLGGKRKKASYEITDEVYGVAEGVAGTDGGSGAMDKETGEKGRLFPDERKRR
jgi:hypothetical protein